MVDELGRVVLPIELRRVLGIDVGTPVEVFTTEKQIILKVYRGSACYFCGNVDGDLIYFKSTLICHSCRRELLDPAREEAAAAVEVPAPTKKPPQKQRRRTPHGETARRLDELLQQYPNAKQAELAEMLEVTPAYVSILLKKRASNGKL
jgi:Regulators of stationary/sporulation gene expression